MVGEKIKMDRLILKSQKKQIHDLIILNELEPSIFEWVGIRSNYDRDKVISQIKCKETRYYFTFDFYDEKHYASFSPGINQAVTNVYTGDWKEQLENVIQWLGALKAEIETTDPWEEIGQYLPGGKINLEDEKENSSFAYKEVEQITTSLQKLKEEISKNYELDANKDEFVQKKLDYLIDRSKKLGRIDWKNIFIATLINIAFHLALNPTDTAKLWNLVKICFKGILLLTA